MVSRVDVRNAREVTLRVLTLLGWSAEVIAGAR